MASSAEIFVSATIADLRTSRQAIRKWALVQGATPVLIDYYPPDIVDAGAWLREKMAGCVLVVHVAGECFGAEVPNAELPPRSFAQLEYETARALGKPVHAFVCTEGFPYDSHDAEPADLRGLQQAYRATLRKARPIRDILDLVRCLKRVRVPPVASASKAKHAGKPRRWLIPVSAAVGTLAIAGLVLAGMRKYEAEVLRQAETAHQTSASQALFVRARKIIETVGVHCSVDWDFTKTISAKERVESAFSTAADVMETPVADLHRVATEYVGEVRGDSRSSEWDRALADFVRLRLEAAAETAAKAAGEFHSERAAEERAAEEARHKAASAGGKFHLRLKSGADATAADERAQALREPEIRAWMLAGESACLAHQIPQALQAFQKALDLLGEKSVSPQWADTAQGMAIAYFLKGLNEESEAMLRKAFERRGAMFGTDSPGNIQALQNLASLLFARNDLEHAEPIFRQVLDARQRTLGAEHSQTLRAAKNLAALYLRRGDGADAAPLFRQILEVQEKALAPDDPALLGTLNNLASVLSDIRDFAGAKAVFERIVDSRTRTLGADDPLTLASMSNLAALLTNSGDYGQAEKIFRHVLEVREQNLGFDDPSVMTTINSLAVMLRAKGDQGAAEGLYRETLEIQQNDLGQKDPATLATLSNLANQLYLEHKIAEAEPLYRRLVGDRQQELGPNDPTTLSSMRSLAYVLQMKGDYAGAKPIYQQILTIQEHTLGKDNAETLSTQQNLANLLLVLGADAEAEPLLQNTLNSRERKLGKNSPDTALSAYAFSSLRRKQRRLREALILAQEAVDGARASLSVDNSNRKLYEQQLAAVQTELAAQDKSSHEGLGQTMVAAPPKPK